MSRRPTRYGVLTRDEQDRLASEYYGYALHCVALHLRPGMRRDPDTVTIVAHDTLTTALRTYDGRVPFRAWLAVQCRYTVLEYVRTALKRRARDCLMVQITPHVDRLYCARPDTSLGLAERDEDLETVIRRIDPGDRDIALAMSDGATSRQICRWLGTDGGHLHRMRQRCREALAGG